MAVKSSFPRWSALVACGGGASRCAYGCTGCGACTHVCPMAVEVPREPDSPECIRCGRCAAVCPEGALSCGFARGVPAANTPDAEKQP